MVLPKSELERLDRCSSKARDVGSKEPAPLVGVLGRIADLAANVRQRGGSAGQEPTVSKPIDVWAIAQRLQLRPIVTDLGSTLWGCLPVIDRPVVNIRLTPKRRRFALAHELGHVMVAAGHARWVSSKDEEWFADWFARELLAPSRRLETVAGSSSAAPTQAENSVREAASSWDVEEEVILLQKASRGLAPALQIFGETVLCAACGHRGHMQSCPCRSLRASIICDGRRASAEVTL